jgi:ABC-type multidrug transport system permease subunit
MKLAIGFRFGGTGSTITIIFSGFLIPTKDMRPYFGWLHYLSPINYAYESVRTPLKLVLSHKSVN